jgi:hypothetical protein
MEGTGDDSVEWEDPRELSSEQVATFVRSLGPAQCFQSAGDQVLQLGVDDSVLYNGTGSLMLTSPAPTPHFHTFSLMTF